MQPTKLTFPECPQKREGTGLAEGKARHLPGHPCPLDEPGPRSEQGERNPPHVMALIGRNVLQIKHKHFANAGNTWRGFSFRLSQAG